MNPKRSIKKLKSSNAAIFGFGIFLLILIYLLITPNKSEVKNKSVRLRQLIDYQAAKTVKAKLDAAAENEPKRKPSTNMLSTAASEKSAPMNTLEDYAGEWLLNLALGKNVDKNRKELLAQATNYPLESVDLFVEILKEVPRDQIEIRDQALAVMIDLAANVKGSPTSLSTKQIDDFFAQINSIALNELKFDEFAPSDLASGLNEEQKDALVHDGFLVRSADRYERSTLSSKILAIKLAQLDLNQKRRSDFLFEVDTISEKLVSEFTRQTLKIVSKNSSVE